MLTNAHIGQNKLLELNDSEIQGGDLSTGELWLTFTTADMYKELVMAEQYILTTMSQCVARCFVLRLLSFMCTFTSLNN